MMRRMKKLVEIKDVHFTYQSKYQKNEVLKGIDGSFAAGKFYAVIGKSGSGKSTLLRLLAGLKVPSRGEILVEGKDLSKIDRDRYRREQVSVIYQELNLFPALTVLENVMFPLQMQHIEKKEAQERAKAYLETVGLPLSYCKKFPEMLSGGEQQRVAIARALGMPGKLILADEPTGNLDVANTRNVIGELRRLAEEKGYCVVVVTHDMEAAKAADVVYELRDGASLQEIQIEGK